MKKKVVALLALSSAFIITGCDPTLPSVDTREKVSITHIVSKSDGVGTDGTTKFTRTEITEEFSINPVRVATFSLGVLDIFSFVGLDVLGIESIAAPHSNLPSYLDEFKNAPHIDAGTLFEVYHTALKLYMPQLIIIDGRTASLYESLKTEYPYADILDASQTTFSFEGQKKVVNNIGKIFPNAATILSEEMTTLANGIAGIKTKVAGHKALFIMSNGFNQNKPVISVSGAYGRFGAIHNDFGFDEAAPGGVISGGDQHGLPVSLENIDEINPEVIWILDRAAIVGDTTNPSSFTSLLAEPIFANLDAAKNGHVYSLDGAAWYTVTGGIKSTRRMIEDINQYVVKLA